MGINTGEALVRLDVNPRSGEGFLTGDAINTASRLQGLAPEMGVAVGVATYEATTVVFDYQELDPATVKGKSEPVRVFQPLAPRARFGTDLTRTHTSPFIGREIDLALLKGIFDKAAASSSVQLVTVVGEPGLGKSRIVAELFGYIDARPELVTWRQGRCLPYGEGITFWALGEIVKAHAGILESDDPATAMAKLDVVLPEGEERAWFRQRLLPLLGIGASTSAEREELFAAWRRFLEHLAETEPTVLVFEDLHWADDALLAFLEHLADRAEGVPLLIVCTARPELFESHPDYAAGLRNTNSINLAPLSQEETARLVSALLDASVIPAELQQPILDRAGGNPLYAEEFVRLLQDRDLLIRKGSSWGLREGAEVPFPESVRALIAARLDTLPPDAKSLIADAAVVGKVFWVGAVAQMGGRSPDDVVDALRELSRKELIRASRRSSMQGEAEYAFWHILTCDVAYAQIPRASRAARHVGAAEWIESKAPGRVEDLADVLAYHYSTALDLARAAGEADRAAELEAPARRFLTLAGERALGLDTTAALTNLERALALTPPTTPRPAGRARALRRGRIPCRPHPRGEGGAGAGDPIVPGARRSPRHGARHARARQPALPPGRSTLGRPAGRGPGTAGTAAQGARARRGADGGRACGLPSRRISETALASAQRALALADELGLERSPRTLGYLGFARGRIGDPRGLDDMREAIRIATDVGLGREVGVLHNNLGLQLWAYEGPQAALDEFEAGIAFASACGLNEILDLVTLSRIEPLIDAGRIDEALEVANGLAARLEVEAPGDLLDVRGAQTRIHTLRGSAAQVAGWLDWLESSAHAVGNAEQIVIGLASAAIAHAALAHRDSAAASLEELATTPAAREPEYYTAYLPALVRSAVALGDNALAQRLITGVESRTRYAEHALIATAAAIAEARGDNQAAADGYADATGRWEQFGVVPEHAFALLGRGRCLVSLGRPSEAAPILQQARGLFHALGATPGIAETDALLETATALSS